MKYTRLKTHNLRIGIMFFGGFNFSLPIQLSNFIKLFQIYNPNKLPPRLPYIMPRKYVRTSNKQLDRTNLEAAFKHRVATNCSMKAAADEFGVKKTTLVVSFQTLLTFPSLLFSLFVLFCSQQGPCRLKS